MDIIKFHSDYEDEVPFGDVLVLQLELTKGHKRFVDMLSSQHLVIADLQNNSKY
jgi:hypothetical protein